MLVGGSWPDDADDGHESVDLADIGHAAERGHGRRLDMVDRPRAASGDHLPDIVVLPRFGRVRIAEQASAIRFVPREAAFQIHGDAAPVEHRLHVAHHSQAALGQDVDFHQANGFDGIHVEVRRRIALVRDEGGRQLAHRLARQHDAAGVHFGIARKAVKEPGHFERRAVRLFVERQVAIFGTGAQQLDQGSAAARGRRIGHPAAAEAPREMLGEAADLMLGHPQHFRHVGDGAAGLIGAEAPDDCAVFAAMPGEEEVHHVVFAVVGKVDVDIGQFVERHPLGIEKTPEVEIEADGANVADAQAVADQAVGRAAPGNPGDALLPARLQEIPHEQEIFLVAHRADDGQLLVDLFGDWIGAAAVTLAQSLQHEPPQEFPRTRTIGRREGGKLRLAKGQLERAAFRDFQRVRQPLGMVPAGGCQLGRRTEMEPAAEAFFRVLLPQQSPRADGLHDVELQSVGGRRVMNCRASHGRLAAAGIARRHRLVETAGEQPGEPRVGADGNESIRKAVEVLEGEGAAFLGRDRFMVRPGFIAGRRRRPRKQLAKIGVTARRFDIEERRLAVDANFGAKDRLDARLASGQREFGRAVQVASVREGDRRQRLLFGQGHDGLGRKRRVQKRIETMRPQRDVAGQGARLGNAAGLHQAPRFLPLLHRMEERAGERRCVFIGFPSPRSSPHSFLAGRGWRA